MDPEQPVRMTAPPKIGKAEPPSDIKPAPAAEGQESNKRPADDSEQRNNNRNHRGRGGRGGRGWRGGRGGRGGRNHKRQRQNEPAPVDNATVLARMPGKAPTEDAPATTYAPPTEIGYFSFGKERSLHIQSRSELKYYYPPNLTHSLAKGFPENYIIRDSKPEHLDALLKCVHGINERRVTAGDKPLSPAFCTWRGIMTKLLCTPFADREAWELGATLYNNTIYIEEHDLDDKHKSKFGLTDQNKLFTYFGYKFENLCTIDVPPEQISADATAENGEDERLKKRETEVVDTNLQFCSVFSTKLGSHDLVCGGEIDCMLRDPKPDERVQDVYVELKTSRVITSDQQQANFARFKLLRMWAQSYLSGVPKIIVGYRNDEGALAEISEYATDDLPQMAKDKQARWTPEACLAFAEKVLDLIKQTVVKEGPNVVYTIRYLPQAKEVQILEPVEDGSNAFIPEDYRKI